MFELKTFGETIRPILLLNVVIGTGSLAPFKNKRVNRIVDIVNMLVNFAIFVYWSVYVEYCYMDSFQPSRMDDNIQMIISGLIIVYGSIIILIIATKFKRKNMQDIIDVVEKIDDEMETIGLRKQHWAQYKRQTCILLIFVSHFTLNVLITWFFRIKPTAPTKQKILISLGSSLPHNITMAVQLSFIIWVRYIGVKFRQVNKLLEAMIEALDLPKPRRFLGEADDRLIERETRNDLRGNVQKIMIAKKCHLDLVWAAKRVNKFYGFQLVLVTLVELMLLIMPLFMLNFMIWNHLPKEDVLFDGFPALIVIFVIWMRIVHLHGNCIHTTNEAKAAGFLLCRLYDSSTTTKFRAEVQNFTQQVLQTPLVFSVCGLVDFDRSFLPSLAGSIFAYLFVIVQLASTQWYLRQELSWNATDLNATLTGET